MDECGAAREVISNDGDPTRQSMEERVNERPAAEATGRSRRFTLMRVLASFRRRGRTFVDRSCILDSMRVGGRLGGTDKGRAQDRSFKDDRGAAEVK